MLCNTFGPKGIDVPVRLFQGVADEVRMVAPEGRFFCAS